MFFESNFLQQHGARAYAVRYFDEHGADADSGHAADVDRAAEGDAGPAASEVHAVDALEALRAPLRADPVRTRADGDVSRRRRAAPHRQRRRAAQDTRRRARPQPRPGAYTHAAA